MPERKYNEAELAAILRAAAEAQSAGSSISNENTGYSLADIERLAAEVGIDPKHIANAAENLPVEQVVEKHFRFWGAPARTTIERTYQGNLDDLSWEETVAELRIAFGSAGTASMVGSSHEWTGGNDFRSAHISATPKGEKTRLRLAINQKDMLVVAWMVGFVLTLFGTVSLGAFLHSRGGSSLDPFVGTTFVLLAYGIIHRLVVRWNAANLVNAQTLLDRIEALNPNLSTEMSRHRVIAEEAEVLRLKPEA